MIEALFNKLHTASTQWRNVNDTEEFSAEVSNHTDAADEQDFTELGHFRLEVLSLLISNAAAETFFSQTH